MYAGRELGNDGYVLLAEAILDAAREDYSYMFPKYCKTYKDFQYYDTKEYAPKRRSLIRHLCNSAVRQVIDKEILLQAFEKSRFDKMRWYGITWEEAYDTN